MDRYKAKDRLVSLKLFPGVCFIIIFIYGFAFGQVIADFTATPKTIYIGQKVKFTDQSTNAMTWDWSFPGGSPDNKTGQGPHWITYNSSGDYNVTLKITFSDFSVIVDSETKTNYIHVLELELDFGDAPDGRMVIYPTLLANDGARHLVSDQIYSGAGVDFEPDGQPNADATGDDLNNDDDDGVVFLTSLLKGQTAVIQVTVSVDGFLNAWVDFDGNSNWDDQDDQIFVDQPLVQGLNTLTFPVPNQVNIANTIHWDASMQPSGIYILRIHAGSFIKNIKMIVLQ